MDKPKPKSKVQKLKNTYLPTNAFYSQVIDSLEDYAVLTTDKNLIINSWNSGAESIFNYKAKEMLGKPFKTIFTRIDIKNGIPNVEIEKATKDGRATDERWHLKKDKTTFYASGLVFPLKDDAKKLIGFVKILRDLTEQKNTEESINKYLIELEELNNHKEKTLSVLSHDLRSPLTSMLASTTYLSSKYQTIEPADAEKMVKILHTSTKKMLDMLNNLVEWARIKYASEIFNSEKINLNDFTKTVVESVQENASLKKIEIISKVDQKIEVLADKKMLNSIIQNILSNAIKFTSKNGKVTLTTKVVKGKALVEIKDTGVGMSKAMAEKLFTPKIESLTTQKKEEDGAGIGLLLVNGFLEKIGGEISVKSTLGKGTSISFTLPIHTNKAETKNDD